MKRPKEFDYDLWIAEDGRYMVRVKATREECAVNYEVFRKLRAEEKRLRREMEGVPTRNIDKEGRIIKATMLSTDFVGALNGKALDPAWLIDPHDFERDLFLRESVCELRMQLTERQLEVFEKCILGGMSLREFAKEKQVNFNAVWKVEKAIQEKFKKFGEKGGQMENKCPYRVRGLKSPLRFLDNRIPGSKITSADVPGEKRDKRYEGCAKTTCEEVEDMAVRLFSFSLFVKDGQERCKAVPIHSKAALASRLAKTASVYNGTPAQPQHTQWGQLGEILGGVRFPEQIARSGFATPPKRLGE